MKKGTQVQLVNLDDQLINGITIEDACSSPTSRNPARMVIRVRWSDNSESIENVDELWTLTK